MKKIQFNGMPFGAAGCTIAHPLSSDLRNLAPFSLLAFHGGRAQSLHMFPMARNSNQVPASATLAERPHPRTRSRGAAIFAIAAAEASKPCTASTSASEAPSLSAASSIPLLSSVPATARLPRKVVPNLPGCGIASFHGRIHAWCSLHSSPPAGRRVACQLCMTMATHAQVVTLPALKGQHYVYPADSSDVTCKRGWVEQWHSRRKQKRT
jgi:hypothetical protein